MWRKRVGYNENVIEVEKAFLEGVVLELSREDSIFEVEVGVYGGEEKVSGLRNCRLVSVVGV